METNKKIFIGVLGFAVLIILAGIFVSDKKPAGVSQLPAWGTEPGLSTSTSATSTTVSTSTATTATSTAELSAMDIFAKCLAEKKLTMYGAVWCSHCQNEKSHFGTSFKYVPYVECPDNVSLCEAKGILGYPTWIDAAGNKHEGEQGIDGLAKISGCAIPK
ncbi:MAG: hypothetical protein WCO10_02815 [bacterium]